MCYLIMEEEVLTLSVLLDVVIFIIGLSYSRQESSFLKNLEKIPMAALGALGQLKGIEMI